MQWRGRPRHNCIVLVPRKDLVSSERVRFALFCASYYFARARLVLLFPAGYRESEINRKFKAKSVKVAQQLDLLPETSEKLFEYH
jgi:hypothetical protein